MSNSRKTFDQEAITEEEITGTAIPGKPSKGVSQNACKFDLLPLSNSSLMIDSRRAHV